MIILQTDNGQVVVPDPGTTPSGPGAPTPQQFGFVWTGTDGVEWDLVAGPAYILSGARGFGLPTPQHWMKETLLNGATHTGLRFPARDVYMPVEIDTDDMLAQDRKFFAGLDPFTEGRLRVTTPDARWRELPCRYVEGAEGEYEGDPLLFKRATYAIRMVAADPFWRGAPVSVSYGYAGGSSFFDGPPFRLAPSNVLGQGTVVNDGDVSAYATWLLEGPFMGFSVGIGTSLVEMTVTKAAGEWVEIDGNPTRLTIRDETGIDLREQASEVKFASIPPGETTIDTTLNGASTGSRVTVSFVPRYYRAW